MANTTQRPRVGESLEGSGAAWTNPGNIATTNTSVATAQMSKSTSTSQILLARDFGFSIPEGSEILGITVEVDRSAIAVGDSPAIAQDGSAQLSLAGVATDADYAMLGSWGSVESRVVYGGRQDLWGRSWTPAEVNSPDFGFGLSAVASGFISQDIASRVTARVRTVHLSVTYAPPGSGEVIGSITESNTNLKVAGATITLNVEGYQSTTNENGDYREAGVPPGTYTATISHPDYRTTTRQIEIAGDQATTVNVALPRVWVGAGAVVRAASGTLNLGLPAGRQVGDLLLAYVTVSATGKTLDIPVGWQEALSPITGTACQAWVLWRIVDGSETATLSLVPQTTTGARAGYIVAYRGVDPQEPIGAYASTTGSVVDRTAPSIAISQEYNRVLRLWRATMTGSFSEPAMHNRRVAYSASTPSVALDEREFPATGPSGTAATTSSATGNGINISLEINLIPPIRNYELDFDLFTVSLTYLNRSTAKLSINGVRGHVASDVSTVTQRVRSFLQRARGDTVLSKLPTKVASLKASTTQGLARSLSRSLSLRSSVVHHLQRTTRRARSFIHRGEVTVTGQSLLQKLWSVRSRGQARFRRQVTKQFLSHARVVPNAARRIAARRTFVVRSASLRDFLSRSVQVRTFQYLARGRMGLEQLRGKGFHLRVSPKTLLQRQTTRVLRLVGVGKGALHRSLSRLLTFQARSRMAITTTRALLFILKQNAKGTLKRAVSKTVKLRGKGWMRRSVRVSRNLNLQVRSSEKLARQIIKPLSVRGIARIFAAALRDLNFSLRSFGRVDLRRRVSLIHHLRVRSNRSLKRSVSLLFRLRVQSTVTLERVRQYLFRLRVRSRKGFATTLSLHRRVLTAVARIVREQRSRTSLATGVVIMAVARIVREIQGRGNQ